jgi:hypothetical protein
MQRRSPWLRLTTLVLGLALITLAQTASAIDPAVSNIQPDGMQKGVETELTITGKNLGDAQELLFYSSGITVNSLEAVKENIVKAKVTVAPECRLGIHALRLRSATGVSNLWTLTVGNFAEVKEVEPNTDFAAPQPIELNITISGVIQNEDVDNYVVELKKGQRLNAEIEGMRLGKSFFDPYLAILNTAGIELARSDDAPLLNQDCLCSIIAPEDGKYIVQVRETSFGGNGNCTYRLHLGSFPRPSAVYPGGGKPGETLEVRWLGDAGGEFTSQVTLPKDLKSNEAFLVAQDANGLAPSPNPIRVIDLQNSLEAEPNDELPQATPAVVPGAMNGIIQQPGDMDFFKFTAKKGQQFDVRVHARKSLRSPLDSVLGLHNAKGGNAGNNDDSGGPDSYVKFNVPADGEYLISVRDQLKAGGPDYVYRVEVTEVKPSLELILPERKRYVSTTLTVPSGNRMALMFNVQRQGVNGELAIDASKLPPGMKLEAFPVPAGKGDVPVLFTAAVGAAPAGSLVDMLAKATDPTAPVVGHLAQRTMLIRGNNNTDVWGHDAERMAAVIAEAAPFSLEIVQPKAPLARNGSMGLKVVAKRDPEFKAPIAIRLLYNPPGVGSSTNVTIPEGQTETVIPLTANSGAAIGQWKLVVTGTAPFDKGTVEVASQFADLTIVDQFYKFAFVKSAVEQGQSTEVVVKVEHLQDFPGQAKCELVGLPNGATTAPVEFNKDTAELVFKVTSAKEARPGRYTTLVCVSKFAYQGEEVTQTLGGGELRIDAPLPPKPSAKPAVAKAASKPAETKRLSRLEQLRLEREQQEKK